MFDSVAMSNSVCSIIKPPSLLICISGKRKSGKDFVASSLKRILHQNFLSSFPQQTGHYKAVKISSCGISHLLKENFANIHGLDAEKLKTDGVYKELVRQKMVKYGEDIRAKDPGFFCRRALQSVCCSTQSTSNDPLQPVAHIVIVSDCRRMTDLAFFQAFQQEHASHPPLLIRVNSLVKTRESRGFVFTAGIDDAETECALDEYDTWDFCIQNDGNQCLDKELNVISDYAKSRLFPQQ